MDTDAEGGGHAATDAEAQLGAGEHQDREEGQHPRRSKNYLPRLPRKDPFLDREGRFPLLSPEWGESSPVVSYR